ncbi:hypothetical protein OS493_009199 [Desmophyllum pertusum]|uniref:Uncharacterized protein n=1 Tax=Desmophyllum pertusum TaxID=174260 RepID=A0A9W9Z2D9_9CNID|nr:hypothetical protein OS493_009199 [Desmophyllum pertusum]
MVKTRENTPFPRTLRSGNGRGKNIGNREEKVPSSDESGLETKPLPAKKRRLRNSEGYNVKLYPINLQATVPLTRSTRASQSQRILNGSPCTVVDREARSRNSQRRGKEIRASSSVVQKGIKKKTEIFVDESDLVRRRSDRKRRKFTKP